jgi:transposase
MILDYQKVAHIFIVCGKTDLRKGIDGLAAIVQHEYNLDVYDDALFLFCGGRRDRFKMLYYEKDGFLLLYKRLDQGQLRWPRSKKASINPKQFLLENVAFFNLKKQRGIGKKQ